MTAAAIVELITGLLTFPKEILTLIQTLKATPEEQRQAIMLSMQNASQSFSDTGRPS